MCRGVTLIIVEILCLEVLRDVGRPESVATSKGRKERVEGYAGRMERRKPVVSGRKLGGAGRQLGCKGVSVRL